MKVETITNCDVWNDALRHMPYAHVLQTWEWGEFKRVTTGWHPERLSFYADENPHPLAMASVLTRRVGPLAVMYVPKGPALDYANIDVASEIITELQHLAKKRRAIWLKIDPDVIAATGVPGEEDDQLDSLGQQFSQDLQANGWRYSADQVQFRNTVTLDLTQSEDDLLAAMSQNTRRKVRTAIKKQVSVRPAGLDDLDTLYDLYAVTGERDHFLIRPPDYYQRAWRDFMQAGLAHALIAEFQGKPIAHVILFHFGQKCWYFYGASSNEERQRMPNYLLQWEAMRWAKSQGYQTYDMWGAPSEFNEDDPLWGVFQFKKGFRGTVVRHIGAWDYAPNAVSYFAYTRLWPRIRAFLRRVK